jgi:hypothetical protein
MTPSKLPLLVILLSTTATFAADRDHPRPLEQSQREYDRGIGRVTDPATHEIDRIQTRDIRTIDEILAERDRQTILDKQQQSKGATALPPATRPANAPSLPGAEINPSDVAGGERVALAAAILSALDQHDQQRDEARQKLSSDPQKLKRRELQLQDEFSTRLANILSGYDIRRSTAPATTAPSVHPSINR